MNSDVAWQLINDALTRMGAVIEPDLYDSIFNWTGRKPFYLKWILSKLADILNQRQLDRNVKSSILEDAKNQFFAETDLYVHFKHLWSHAKQRYLPTVLSLIAPETGPYDDSGILESLKKNKLIEGDDKALQHLKDDLNRLTELHFLYKQ
ncbi:MAG: hypothetical protein GY816_15035, partial [Cytophagales bacterium]|nr:hypothetical protein [Cytophagales bacterium]